MLGGDGLSYIQLNPRPRKNGKKLRPITLQQGLV
jgi:hypothetical protein